LRLPVLGFAAPLDFPQRGKSSLRKSALLSRIRAVYKSVFYNQEPDAGTVPATHFSDAAQLKPRQPL